MYVHFNLREWLVRFRMARFYMNFIKFLKQYKIRMSRYSCRTDFIQSHLFSWNLGQQFKDKWKKILNHTLQVSPKNVLIGSLLENVIILIYFTTVFLTVSKNTRFLKICFLLFLKCITVTIIIHYPCNIIEFNLYR